MATSYDSFKELGNQLFLKTSQDGNLSPVLYQERMCQALQFFNKAGNLATTARQVSSIRKNVAVPQLRIAEKLNWRLRHLRRNRRSKQKKQELQFFLEEALKNFEEAIGIGQSVQNHDWVAHIKERKEQCVQLFWDYHLMSHNVEEFSVLCAKLHQFCWNLVGCFRAQQFLKLGHLTFKKAVEYQEGGKALESLQLLHNNYLNIEEAKKLVAQLEEAVELEENNFIHLCIGDSALARQNGDKLWKEATCENENIRMELVWDAVDCYVQSIVLARGKCLESEAMAHSQLGRLYELLVMNVKSHEHYKLTVDLVVAMEPKNFNNYPFYKQALAGLDKFQQSETLRRETFSGEKPTNGSLKAKLKKALLAYHPDKQDVNVHGFKWVVLSEEITILLTYHFSC